MKRFLLALLALTFCMGAEAQAQAYKYNAVEYSYRTSEDGSTWSSWSDWADCKHLVVINLDKEDITIYTDPVMEYSIYDMGDKERDANGGEQLHLSCVDNDGDRCTLRLRVQSDGIVQLYVDYSNISLVYHLEER